MEVTATMGLAKPNVNDEVTETVEAIAESFDKLDKAASWVGMIVQSSVEVDLEAIYGGTWSRIEGVFLVGAGDAFGAGSTGGSKAHKHLMPIGFDSGTMYGYYSPAGDTPAYGSIVQKANTKKWAITASAAEENQRIGYTQDAEALPPYKAVYMYERVA
ncbi:hypothetical protein [Gordonibacter massiliensis (ex Traore et al. 2017)]|uniref:hypothetical protein n=1 Tax=Gordonibacter massiliensis (ex Traore et al. 2017) TaxID=1841863 RepID=UPI001C8CF29D|nr:hypothetical protein [Gordonibacter massiliensis (ex Traore et al. 2017)]MBX9035027.1 hypothetical protein [Gordonibacter massiliensis (ex Traore et al. 2017)]